MSYFVKGPYGWVEADHCVGGTPPDMPERPGWKWKHPDPQHWHDVRAAALERDKWRCVACSDKMNLNAHHRTYVRWGKEKVEDVYILCRACHETFHAERRLAA